MERPAATAGSSQSPGRAVVVDARRVPPGASTLANSSSPSGSETRTITSKEPSLKGSRPTRPTVGFAPDPPVAPIEYTSARPGLMSSANRSGAGGPTSRTLDPVGTRESTQGNITTRRDAPGPTG